MTRPSSLMGNFTSQLPTMFWILNSMNLACHTHTLHHCIQTTPTQRAYRKTKFLNDSSILPCCKSGQLLTMTETGGEVRRRSLKTCSTHLLAPVHTIFPELKTSAVVLGSLILIITAANLYTTHLFQMKPHPQPHPPWDCTRHSWRGELFS